MDLSLERRKKHALVFPEVHAECITKTDEGKFLVKSSDSCTTYEVDCFVGMCTCAKGNTGKPCKHQSACAEYDFLHLPQVYKGSPEERMLLMKIATGNNELSLEFFTKHHDAKSIAENCLINEAPMQHFAVETESVHKDPEESPSMTPAETQQLWNECFDIMKLGYNHSPQLHEALLQFRKRAGTREAESAVISFLKSAGQCSGAPRGRKSMIRVQPNSVSRRKGPKKGGHGAVMKGGIRKRNHNLASNIAANVPNAKQH